MSRSVHIAFLSAAALLAATGAPAFAQDYESRVVTYSGLNLDTAAGADTLIRRINNAAASVCGRNDGPRPVRAASAGRVCAHETAQNAVDDVNHPVVTARYLGSGYAVIEEGSASYDPTLDPASSDYIPPAP